jgi:hypothetical protein
MKSIAPTLLLASLLAQTSTASTTNTAARLGQTLAELHRKFQFVSLVTTYKSGVHGIGSSTASSDSSRSITSIGR